MIQNLPSGVLTLISEFCGLATSLLSKRIFKKWSMVVSEVWLDKYKGNKYFIHSDFQISLKRLVWYGQIGSYSDSAYLKCWKVNADVICKSVSKERRSKDFVFQVCSFIIESKSHYLFENIISWAGRQSLRVIRELKNVVKGTRYEKQVSYLVGLVGM